ncbi:MAG: hypothetical protein AAF512_11875, partial [Pseudomonadota bacterium]
MNEQNLDAYVKKILEIEKGRLNHPLTQDELKDVAQNLGMSEGDWEAIQATFDAHLERGLGYLKYDNWEDAIAELDQAIILNPSHLAALFGLAQAQQKRWEATGDEVTKNKAEVHAKKCLDIDPGHDPALRLLSELKQPKTSTNLPEPLHRQSQKKASRRMLIVGATVGLLVLVGLSRFLLAPSGPDYEYDYAPPLDEPINAAPLAPNPPPALNAPPAISSPVNAASRSTGSYNVDVVFQNDKHPGLSFEPDSSMQSVYDDSYSYELTGSFFSSNLELSHLELKVELLDGRWVWCQWGSIDRFIQWWCIIV